MDSGEGRSCSSSCWSSSASARFCGSRSPRSRRRATPSAIRCRCSRTALPGATCAEPGSTSTSGATSGTRSSSRFGSWLTQIIVATTGGYALSVLRPRYAKLITAMLLATLFVPAVVLLVPLYIEIVRPAAHPPLVHRQLLGGLAACRGERLQRHHREALLRQPSARDLRGRAHRRRRAVRAVLAIVLPMSKPILGVVSVFAVLASWKDFLWPMLVLTNPDKQPLWRAAARHPIADGTRRVPCRHVHRVHRSDRRLSDLPALVPAEFRPRRRDQGLVAEPMCTAYASAAPDGHATTQNDTNRHERAPTWSRTRT